MSKIVIVILIYHRHQPIDFTWQILIYYCRICMEIKRETPQSESLVSGRLLNKNQNNNVARVGLIQVRISRVQSLIFY
jgi:hypothetical protein